MATNEIAEKDTMRKSAAPPRPPPPNTASSELSSDTTPLDLTDGADAAQDRGESTAEHISVQVGTFNINGKPPRGDDGEFVDLQAWISPDTNFDIRVFGFQELDDEPQTLMLNLSSPKVVDWTEAIESQLPKGKYKRLAVHSMVGIAIMVFAEVKLARRITGVLAATLATGMMGLGNKGGVGVRFDIDKTGFCFVCTHLAAHQGGVAKRNSDFRDIIQGMKFWDEPEKDSGSMHILQHERVVWLGDLNYRVDCERERLMSLIEQKRYSDALKNDQLTNQRDIGAVFRGFEESAITFAPTYKYDPGTEIFDSSPKARLPAWCDRVLSLATDGDGIECTTYTSHTSIMFSDHRPVSAVFRVNLLPQSSIQSRRPERLAPINLSQRPSSVSEAARDAVTGAGAAASKLLGSITGSWG